MKNDAVFNLLADIRKLKEVANTQIRTKELDDLQTALQQRIGQAMILNAEEFVTVWLIHQNEYVPLTRGIAALLARASSSLEGSK